ncbi:hypothetical protein [Pseudonocardia acaciae]|uniref:hypothetical protein n=1 Tax=Pseudonocardia acaciae TaxID=551276 RepID=UPI000AD30F96|nr:hypothetical protein [Pseudonocardia acaciae]
MHEDTDPAVMLGHAEQIQVQIRRAGRWYPALMIVFGVLTIGIVAWVPVIDDTATAIAFALVIVAWIVGFSWWKSRHHVRPTSRRDTRKWVVAWAMLYVTAVSWFGPTYLDHAVGWWALMGVVVAAPAFHEAIRVWLRVRR